MHAQAWDIQWTGGSPQDRRFKRLQWISLAVCLVSVALVSVLPVVKPERPPQPQVPERIARLVIEARKPPPPPPRQEQAEPQPEPEPEPEQAKAEPEPPPEPAPPAPRPTARARAERAGVMAFRDALADLRQAPTLDKLAQASRQTTGAAAGERTAERAILTANTGRGSGGVDTSKLSRDAGRTQLARRDTSRVSEPAATRDVAALSRPRPSGLATRSDEDIELVFDRNKSLIYNIYNRSLRSNPALRGKVVFRLTIAPDGTVTAIDVVSSELGDKALERKLVLRIKRFDFGARQVAATTVRYTIDFFPS